MERHSATIVHVPSHTRTEVTDVLAVCEVASDFFFFYTRGGFGGR